MTKGDIFQIRVSLSDEKIWRKCSDVRLHDVSRKSQMKHPMTSQWYVTKFLKEISRVFNWQFRTENSDSEECISNLTLKFQKIIDCKSTLKTIRDDNLNKVIFAHLNINSIRNKFEELISQVKGTIDVLMISETKIDDSFPKGRVSTSRRFLCWIEITKRKLAYKLLL